MPSDVTPSVPTPAMSYPSLWQNWGALETPGCTWHHALAGVTELVADHHNLLPLLVSLADEREETEFDLALQALQAGAIIGFALAQTWPPTLQEMSEWPSQADQRANLDQWLATI